MSRIMFANTSHPSSCVCLLQARVGQPLEPRPRVAPIGEPDVPGHPVPVGDLRAGMGLGIGLGRAARQRVAIEVVELGGELADDPRLALGRQPGQPKPRAHERLPLTHRRRP